MAPAPAFCSIHGDCSGLHDPFVCRVVPAALRWMMERRATDPLFYTPPGLIDAVLTQTIVYCQQYELANMLQDFCEYVARNHMAFFDAVYRDETPDLAAFQNYMLLVTTEDMDTFFL